MERYEFMGILPCEADRVAEIENICFPPNEACKEEIMKKRVELFPETFVVAKEKTTGKIVGFLDALATDEHILRDEFFTDPTLHDPEGSQIMIMGVDVLPDYQRQGIARAMMAYFLEEMKKQGRERVVLTCLEGKISMYEKFGFTDLGPSGSEWGGESWHEMDYLLGRSSDLNLEEER